MSEGLSLPGRGLPQAPAEISAQQARRVLLASLGITALLYIIPGGEIVGYPLLLLSTFVHEMGHGLSAIAVGGRFIDLQIFADGSGVAVTGTSGGAVSRAAVAAGGLVGPAFASAAGFTLGRRPRIARISVLIGGILTLVAGVVWVRSLVGWLIVLGLAAISLARGDGDPAGPLVAAVAGVPVGAAWPVGVQPRESCFAEGASTGAGFGPSDSAAIADALLLPYWFWGAVCGLVSLLALAYGAWVFLRASLHAPATMGESLEAIGRPSQPVVGVPGWWSGARRLRGSSAVRTPMRSTGGAGVPGFGDPDARLVVLGLAPAAHGANRTGRMFTGDRSGDFLYAALHRAGLANQPTSVSRATGCSCRGVWITAPVRCAPPANKPTAAERDTCAPYLHAELEQLRPPGRAVPGPVRVGGGVGLPRSALAQAGVRAWGGGRGGRADVGRQLPRQPAEHVHRPADPGDVRRGPGHRGCARHPLSAVGRAEGSDVRFGAVTTTPTPLIRARIRVLRALLRPLPTPRCPGGSCC